MLEKLNLIKPQKGMLQKMNKFEDFINFLENKNPAIKTILENSIHRILNQIINQEQINDMELLTIMNNIMVVFTQLETNDWIKIQNKLNTKTKEQNDLLKNKNFVLPDQKLII